MEQKIVRKRTSAGRRKIEIKKIEDSERRRVSFSKRRKTLFAKAETLKSLCGVEVAVIVQYPGGKVRASGERCDVYPIIDRYHAEAAGTSCSCGGGNGAASVGKIKSEGEELKGLTAIDQNPNNGINNNADYIHKGLSSEHANSSFHPGNSNSNGLHEYMAALERFLHNDEAAPSNSWFPHRNLGRFDGLPTSLGREQ